MLAIIISALIAVSIPLVIWIRKSYVVGPELTIEIKRDGGGSMPIGFSNKNIPDADGAIDMREALQIFRLIWKIEIVIWNNSELTAYYTKIQFENQQPPFVRIEKLNEHEPIASKAKVVLKAEYQELEEAKGYERNQMRDLPTFLKEMEILLEYKNSSKTKFYTLYKNVDATNTFLRKKPKKFSNK